VTSNPDQRRNYNCIQTAELQSRVDKKQNPTCKRDVSPLNIYHLSENPPGCNGFVKAEERISTRLVVLVAALLKNPHNLVAYHPSVSTEYNHIPDVYILLRAYGYLVPCPYQGKHRKAACLDADIIAVG